MSLPSLILQLILQTKSEDLSSNIYPLHLAINPHLFCPHHLLWALLPSIILSTCMIFPVLHLHIRESPTKTGLSLLDSKAGALVILYSNPQNGNVTTPLQLFLSLFWCVYGRLNTADYLKSSSCSHITVTPCSLTYWLIPCDALGQFLKQGLCLLRGVYIMS